MIHPVTRLARRRDWLVERRGMENRHVPTLLANCGSTRGIVCDTGTTGPGWHWSRPGTRSRLASRTASTGRSWRCRVPSAIVCCRLPRVWRAEAVEGVLPCALSVRLPARVLLSNRTVSGLRAIGDGSLETFPLFEVDHQTIAPTVPESAPTPDLH